MQWLSSHPYVVSAVCAVGLVLVGGFIVVQKSAISATPYASQTWEGAGAGPVPVLPAAQPNSYARPAPKNQAVNHQYVSPFTSGKPVSDASTPGADADFDQFITALTKPSSGPKQTIPLNTVGSYEFVPNGLFSIPDTTNKDTELQAVLRQYGNAVGSVIQSFELEHPNQVAVLKNFMEERNSADKINAMKTLGDDFSNMAHLIAQTTPVPTQMREPATALAKAYLELGKYLSAIPDAKGDSALFDAIVAYNTSAERFVNSFVTFALLFPATGVVFSQSESGSIFSFQGQSGGF